MEKIQKDDWRASAIKQERQQLISIRQKIRREMDEQKEKIVSDFYARQKKNNASATNFKTNGATSNPNLNSKRNTEDEAQSER